jgi:peptidoglycan/LPS O-acetylase OafA/YrhL
MNPQPPNPLRPRIDWIDQVKGGAILGIVLFHFFQNYPQQLGWVAVLNRNGARLGYAAVDIFFVMAGFNIALVFGGQLLAGQALPQQGSEWAAWLKKRLLRLYPTYGLAVIACLLLYWGLHYRTVPLDLKLGLTVLGWAGYNFQALNPGFWFFTVILQAYLVMPLLVRLGGHQPRRWLVLGLSLGLLTKAAALLSRSSPLYLYFLQTNFIGSYIFQVCLGVAWGLGYAQRGQFRRRDWQAAGLVFGLGLLLYGAMTWRRIEIVYMLGFDMAFSGLMFLGLYQLCQVLVRSPIGRRVLAPISVLGRFSYQIYLVHQPLYFVLFPWLNKAIGLGFGLGFNLQVMVIFMVMGLALSVYVTGFSAIDRWVNRWIQDYLGSRAARSALASPVQD